MKLEIKKTTDANYTDISSYIAHKGLTYSINDVDSDGAGRTLDGVMQRSLIANKIKLEISCIPLTTNELNTLATFCKEEWLNVKLTTNSGAIALTMYPNATFKSTILFGSSANETWDGVKFNLIER